MTSLGVYVDNEKDLGISRVKPESWLQCQDFDWPRY